MQRVMEGRFPMWIERGNGEDRVAVVGIKVHSTKFPGSFGWNLLFLSHP